MKLFKQVLSVGLVGAALVAVPARGASAAPQAATAAGVKADNDALKDQIGAGLKKSSLAPRSIDVRVENGVATLKGKVKTIDERTLATSIAKVPGVTRVENLIEVDPKVDESTIDKAGEKTKAGVGKAVDATTTAAEKTKEGVAKGVGKTEEGVGKAADKTANAVAKAGDKTTDASITTKVKADFSAEKVLHNSAIDVDTTDHVVTLRGTVDSAEAKARAGEIAGRSAGVTRVVNELVVR